MTQKNRTTKATTARKKPGQTAAQPKIVATTRQLGQVRQKASETPVWDSMVRDYGDPFKESA